MKILFAPVSGPRGFGEYARAREIAVGVSQAWPNAEIRFVLSREAPYAAECPFPATLLPSSPTFHSREVAAILLSYRPDVVLFDNAGRTAQLRVAREIGAKIIYVSSRPRQRRKAFRPRWMRLLDEHWIAYPEFIAGPLTPMERLKLRVLGKPAVRFLDTIIPEITSFQPAEPAPRGLDPGSYILIVLGGGTAHRGAEDAPHIAATVAARLAGHGRPVVLVGGISPEPRPDVSLLEIPRVPMAELMSLVENAGLVITNGGDTMLQVLARARPCIACPVAYDQAERIARCAAAGLLVEAALDVPAIEQAALALLSAPARLKSLEERLAQYPIVNGFDTALTVFSGWLSGRSSACAI